MIEGFLLFDDERILNFCDKKLFLNIDDNTILFRRMTTLRVPYDYFNYCILPRAQSYRNKIEKIKDKQIIKII